MKTSTDKDATSKPKPTKTRATVKARTVKAAREVTVKSAEEIKVIGDVKFAADEKANLEQKYQQEGKDAKELVDIEAGIEAWLTDQGWFMTMESGAARGMNTFVIDEGMTVNPYAQAKIAAGYLRGLGFRCVVHEGKEGKVLVDVVWN